MMSTFLRYITVMPSSLLRGAMRVIALFSGGKDSTYALHWAVLHGMDVVLLLTVVPRREDSWMFHRPFARYTGLQAKAMGMGDRHLVVEVSGVKEREVDELKEVLARVSTEVDADGVVVGALASDYQRMRVAMIAEDLGLKVFTPQWHVDQERYLLEIVSSGIRFVLVSISAYGLPHELLGRVVDEGLARCIALLAKRYGFNPAFEGGEAETFVVDAPLFQKRIRVRGRVVRLSSYEAVFEPLELVLEPKSPEELHAQP